MGIKHMGSNKDKYDVDNFKCAQIVYKRIAFQEPKMILQGFSIQAIKEIIELHSLADSYLELAEEIDFDSLEIRDLIQCCYFYDAGLIDKRIKAIEERLSPKGDARALRLQEDLLKKIKLAPITRLGLYYLFEIETVVINEEVDVWLSEQDKIFGKPGTCRIPYFGGDSDRQVRCTHLELLENTAIQNKNMPAAVLILLLRLCMVRLDARDNAGAIKILKKVYAETLTKDGEYIGHIETLQYCAELFLDCSEPIPALKCFLRFAYRVRKNETCIRYFCYGKYEIVKDSIEVELDCVLIAKLIARFSKIFDKKDAPRRKSIYYRLKKKVPIFGHKLPQRD